MTRKKNLYTHCHQLLIERVEQAKKAMDDAQNDANSETKNSAGDKHETGRAMAQLDKEMYTKRHALALQTRYQFEAIDIAKHDTVRLGSLVTTNRGIFFIAVGLGNVLFAQTQYQVISPQAPIGMILLGLEEGDTVFFRGKEIEIEYIE